jgi:hypothetical protein
VRATDNEGGQAEQQTEIDAGVPVNAPPSASLSLSAPTALPGETITLDAGASSDADGSIASYEYDPEGDGTFLFNIFPGGFSTQTWFYTQPGTYHPTVRITDDKGASAKASKTVTVSYGTLVKGKQVDDTGGEYPSIGVANSKACVAYMQDSQLAFVRATTSAGGTWFAPQLLGGGGVGCSLAIVSGQPAIAYHDNFNARAAFVRASNVDGSAWASAHTVVSGPDELGVFPTLAVIGGNPAVTCNDATALFSGVSWYVQATNSTGTAWGTKKQISASGKYGICTALVALTAGTPCALLGRSNGSTFEQVQFGLALDNNGTAWNPPITVDTSNSIPGVSGGLQIVAGRPGARTAKTTRLPPSRASRASIASAVVSSPSAISKAAPAPAIRPSKLKSARSFTIRCVASTRRPGSSARERNIIA